jgi:uncharacterized protein YtpQ (UPF0354 family)
MPTEPAAASPETPSDLASAEGFTRAALSLVRQGDPLGGWSTPATLKLTNTNGILVNLERVWAHCEAVPTTCDPELKHLAAEVLKVSTRQVPLKATADRLFAVVRPTTYLDGMPADVRAQTLFEPLTADLIVVYVFDEGGAVRGAQEKDLADVGMTRSALPVAARRNLVAILPVPAGQPSCRPHALGSWNTGNYFESSRLLLSDFWQDMAARTHLPIVVAAPGADTLLVACDPTPSELTRLAGLVEKMSQNAARPVSTSLLKWTANGWQQLPP